MPWILERQKKGGHTPPHQEVSHQFEEAIRCWTETGNNAETSDHRRDLQHHLQIHPRSLPSHPS